MRILFDTRWQGPQGIARFGREIYRRLPGVEPLPRGMRLFNPLDPVWLAWTIRRADPDAYFSPGFNPPGRTPKPFVFVIHDLNYVYCKENRDPLRRAYFELLVRPACRRAARVLTVSEYSRRQIVEWANVPNDHVINVGNGVDGCFTPEGPCYEPGYPYILYVGNRLPHKNLPRLIHAFAQARLDCKLLLTGRPDAKLMAVAAHCAAADALRFAGDVSDQDLPALYRGAQAVVLPSLSEGFGLPVIEAMACGVPVLASNVTSLPEIAGEAAFLFDPTSVEQIALALRRIVQDGELRAMLSKKGLARALLFSWERTASLTSSVLRDASR